MAVLRVYVDEGCFACEHALEVAERVRRDLPAVEVQVVDLQLATDQEHPEEVFAVPTFTLDGAIVSLGTPAWDELSAKIEAALAL